MPLQPLKFRPGINREVTPFTNEGGWRDGDKIRFRNGLPEKIGGWNAYIPQTTLKYARALHPWVDLTGSRYLGVGTTYKYYLMSSSELFDITPIRLTQAAGSTTFAASVDALDGAITATATQLTLSSASGFPVQGVIKIDSEVISYTGVSTNTLTGLTRGAEGTTAASHTDTTAVFCATLTVTNNDHAVSEGDFVTFSGATGLGGAITADVLNQEYQISAPLERDNPTTTFYVTAREVATVQDITVYGEYTPTYVFPTASDTGSGGSSTVAAYQIVSGTQDAVSGLGWGAGGWGRGAWNSAVETLTTATSSIRIWSHDNFGEDLLICPRNGGVYWWDKTSGTSARAVALSDISGADGYAPTVAKQVLVSDIDRHVIVFGCDGETSLGTQDPMLIRFGSQESLTEWRTAETNTAGELRVSSGSEIVTAIKTRQQILVFTDAALYSMQYIGAPYTFGVQQLSGTITIAGPKSAVAVEDRVFWMGDNEFYLYDGVIKQIPCQVRDYVFSDLNRDQIEKVAAGTNVADAEVWWHYPSASSAEPDKYVIYNYAQNIWYYGTMGRTAWLDRGIFEYPMAVCQGGCIREQEIGFDAINSAMTAYIESSPVDISEGERFMLLRRLLPDVSFRSSTSVTPKVTITVKAGNYPGDDVDFFGSVSGDVSRTVSLPYEQFTDKLDLRLRGRAMAMRIESDQLGTTWRLGTPRADVKPDGGR